MPSPDSAMAGGPDDLSLGIVTGSVSRSAGGLFHSVRQSVLAFHRAGVEVQVYAPSDQHSAEDIAAWSPVKPCVLKRRGPHAAGYGSGMEAAILGGGHDIVHLHGIWQYPSVCTAAWGKKTGNPVMISPRGMLDPWAVSHARWKKWLAGRLFEHANLRNADCLHALNESEANSMRSLGLKNPIAIIPNGTNLPDLQAAMGRPEFCSKGSRKILLFLGRIHEKKGIIELIDAWGKLRQRGDPVLQEWQLAIAGWDDGGHLAKVVARIKNAGLKPNDVILPGPLHGSQKDEALAAVDAFILPSKSEGLPMSVLEAWSWGLPVLMTQECNLGEGFARQAAIEIPRDPDGLADSLSASLSEGDLNEFGVEGRRLAEEKFAWPHIAEEHLRVYRWMLNRGDKPDCVRLD